MSQLVSLLNDSSVVDLAVLLVLGTWVLLVLTTALVATFHRAATRRRAALCVLDRLLKPVLNRTGM